VLFQIQEKVVTAYKDQVQRRMREGPEDSRQGAGEVWRRQAEAEGHEEEGHQEESCDEEGRVQEGCDEEGRGEEVTVPGVGRSFSAESEAPARASRGRYIARGR